MRFLLVLLALVIASPAPQSAWAVQPDEMLADPVLEARAREISKELRCLVCQNESIDDSNADLAKDLRLLVRERLTAGDSDQQVQDYLVQRYGEFVLLKPRFSMANALLWLAGPLVFVAGIAVVVASLRRRRPRPAGGEAPLSAAERTALEKILRREG